MFDQARAPVTGVPISGQHDGSRSRRAPISQALPLPEVAIGSEQASPQQRQRRAHTTTPGPSHMLAAGSG